MTGRAIDSHAAMKVDDERRRILVSLIELGIANTTEILLQPAQPANTIAGVLQTRRFRERQVLFDMLEELGGDYA